MPGGEEDMTGIGDLNFVGHLAYLYIISYRCEST